jgi:hypothetical protein
MLPPTPRRSWCPSRSLRRRPLSHLRGLLQADPSRPEQRAQHRRVRSRREQSRRTQPLAARQDGPSARGAPHARTPRRVRRKAAERKCSTHHGCKANGSGAAGNASSSNTGFGRGEPPGPSGDRDLSSQERKLIRQQTGHAPHAEFFHVSDDSCYVPRVRCDSVFIGSFFQKQSAARRSFPSASLQPGRPFLTQS